MGNCLVLEDRVIRVMKTDGKILEYQAPIKVEQVLLDFSGHALSDSFTGYQHLQQDEKLLPGLLYYLIPIPSPSKTSKRKKVRFTNIPDEQGSTGVVRIKLIISKKELQELVQKGVSAHDMQSKQNTNGVSVDDDNCRRKWKPALESIDEVLQQ
ncbi:hypothetical protein V6N13_048804 [Hibiscus sabdariffa]|uniref:Uncharacterized protein n=1 Tax=Hibiscus sabdariffa TaxID=183260 RepID=A0ABR2DIK0_9ROSI